MGLYVAFCIYYHGPCVFSLPYKDSLCPNVSPCDGLHTPLLTGRERGWGGEKKEGKNEGKNE